MLGVRARVRVRVRLSQGDFFVYILHACLKNKIFRTGPLVYFADLMEIPHYNRKETNTKKILKSFWMTFDENFEIIKEIEIETAKKEAEQKQKEIVKKEAVTKFRKEKAAIKRKQKKNVLRRMKSNPKLETVSLERRTSGLADRLR